MTTTAAARYHGRWSDGGGLVTVEDNHGHTIGVLAHVVRHSPSGFAWGYSGSGPADLARSLLIDALGDNANCPTCAGTGHVVWDADTDQETPYRAGSHDAGHTYPCPDCDGGVSPVIGALYQRFKFAVIAGLPQHRAWRLTRDEILHWVATQRSEPAQ